MDRTDPWGDFETIKHNVKHNIVDKLKLILGRLNAECHANLTKTGKKQEIIDKITNKLDIWRRANDVNSWVKAKNILIEVRNGGYSNMRTTPSYPGSTTYTTFTTSSPPSASTAHGSNHHPMYPHPGQSRYDPYSQRRQGGPPTPIASTSNQTTASDIQFKPSPFFRVDRLASSVVECPESASPTDRKQQTVSFLMNSEVAQKLTSQSPTYQLRLYCTSSTFYSPGRSVELCAIEFPPTCEVRINGVQLTANLKGLKKKPGTAPPPDIAIPNVLRIAPNASNKVEMVYVNSAQQTQGAAARQFPKKYYMVVMLVEVTTVDQLIARLRKGKYKSNTEILAKMQQHVDEEDDIVAGHQKMSLKCPLSYMRITTPCRSSTCVHPQCFDAFSWFSVMEQATTWACPVCEQVLDPDDLIIDGYFDEILKATPDDVEDVIVEPDGEWHTDNNKYASTAWKAAHPASSSQSSFVKKQPLSPVKVTLKQENGAKSIGPFNNAEIVILDSDDEDDNRVKRELSPSTDGTGARKSGRTSAQTSLASIQPRSLASDVIDLTLDSDDEEPQHIPPPVSHHLSVPQTVVATKKRDSSELDSTSPTESIWKKSRTDGGTPSASRYVPAFSPPGSARPLPSSSTGRYQTPYQLFSPPYSPPYPPHTVPFAGVSSNGFATLPQRPAGQGSSSANGRYQDDQYNQRRPNGSGSSSSSAWR
ncbi:hypothetical protein QCA50_001925 [Cerrena zonata]|uniref:Uncharacterized protein n=1 Tax=Cerrena zonata TaxID=2478898 RepID=A0AAW0GWW6_9APHY